MLQSTDKIYPVIYLKIDLIYDFLCCGIIKRSHLAAMLEHGICSILVSSAVMNTLIKRNCGRKGLFQHIHQVGLTIEESLAGIQVGT